MGIKGLLQVVKPILKSGHISDYRGKKVAIDGYCWLHKSVYSCCVELWNGQRSDSWIKYCMSFLDALLDNGVQVVMVFDGANLPMKGLTENDRKLNRETNLQRARELMRNGDKEAARNLFARAVDITPAMAAELIQIIKQNRPQVQCIVAPYEADAQLAYLSSQGLVDAVVTEDSDTIPYGCKDIIFKLDRSGACQRLLLADLYSQGIDKFDLRTFSEDMILTMCILSGCDYLDSVKGMGLKTSYKHVVKHRTTANVLKALRLAGQLPVIPAAHPTENNPNVTNTSSNLLQYELDFYQAILTFNHQVVFDPVSRKAVHRTPLRRDQFPPMVQEIWWPNEDDLPCLPFLGSLMDDALAQGIADGLVDPCSKVAFDLNPLFAPPMNRERPAQQQRNPPLKTALHGPVTTSGRSTAPQFFARATPLHQPSGSSAHTPTLTKSATISAALSRYQQPDLPSRGINGGSRSGDVVVVPSSSSSVTRPPLHPAASAVQQPKKSYFASSSTLQRYSSMSGPPSSSSSSSSSGGGSSIVSYFKTSAFKPSSLPPPSLPWTHSSELHPTEPPPPPPPPSAKPAPLQSIFDRFKAKPPTLGSTTSASTIAAPGAAADTPTTTEETIDLSFDSGDDDEDIGGNGGGESALTNSASLPPDSLDFYDVTFITPEKAMASAPGSSSAATTAVVPTTVVTVTAQSQSSCGSVTSAPQSDERAATVISLLGGRHPALPGPTPPASRSTATVSVAAVTTSGGKKSTATTATTATTTATRSVIKAGNGRCISKFFASSSAKPSSSSAPLTLENSSDVAVVTVERLPVASLQSDEPDSLLRGQHLIDTGIALRSQHNDVEQLADRLLGPTAVDGSAATKKTTLENGPPSPLLIHPTDPGNVVVETEVDWYAAELHQDSLPLDSGDDVLPSSPSSSSSSTAMEEDSTHPTATAALPTAGGCSTVTTKRSSMVAFSAETSLARLQRRRVSEAQWTLTQLSSTTDAERTPNTTTASSLPSSPLDTCLPMTKDEVYAVRGASMSYVVEAESGEDPVHGHQLPTSTTVHTVKKLGLFDKFAFQG